MIWSKRFLFLFLLWVPSSLPLFIHLPPVFSSVFRQVICFSNITTINISSLYAYYIFLLSSLSFLLSFLAEKRERERESHLSVLFFGATKPVVRIKSFSGVTKASCFYFSSRETTISSLLLLLFVDKTVVVLLVVVVKVYQQIEGLLLTKRDEKKKGE